MAFLAMHGPDPPSPVAEAGPAVIIRTIANNINIAANLTVFPQLYMAYDFRSMKDFWLGAAWPAGQRLYFLATFRHYLNSEKIARYKSKGK